MIRLMLTTSLLAAAGAAPAAPPVRVMSFNLRYATAPDGDNAWDKRRALLAETVRTFDPDLLGTQETLAVQRDFLLAELPGYEAFGVGRDDGKEAGEMAALFFKAARFEKVGGGHFWLSPTPDAVGSKGWDAALPRIATWVKLKDRLDPAAEPVLFLNTHFDHRGKLARARSARLVRERLLALGEGCRLVVTGDFNAGEGSEPHRNLFEELDAVPSPLVDTFRALTPERKPGEGTFNGFNPFAYGGERIDWIGASRGWDVRLAGIDRTGRDRRTPSDHFPVFAVLRPAAPAGTLRVLSYNIHHGEGTDGKLDLPRIARVIRDADPDFVALQEVDDRTKRTGGVDQTAELARLTGLHGRFQKAIDYQGGGYGQALLSRYELSNFTAQMLPGDPEREQRMVVSASGTLGGRPLTFAGTHLHHADEATRLKQAEYLVRSFDTGWPMVLVGDLNARPDSRTFRLLNREWANATAKPDFFTFPAGKPAAQIDYVLFRPVGALTVAEARVLDEPVASDHRPVLAVLRTAAELPKAYAPYSKPTNIAHRGASADAPEHTLAAYELALEQGADYLEPDLQMTKDGVLVCLHDMTLERTTNVEEVYPDRAKVVGGRKTWPVAEFTLAEVERLDAGVWKGERFAGQRVPTFEQVIKVARLRAGLIPETKAPDAYGRLGLDMEKALLAVLKRYGYGLAEGFGTSRVVIQSFSAESLKKLRAAGCKLPLVYLFSGGDTSPAALKAMKEFADGVAPNKALVLARPQLVADAHALGMSVTVWTCRAGQTDKFPTVRDEMRHLLRDLKVDAIFTDNPDQFPRD